MQLLPWILGALAGALAYSIATRLTRTARTRATVLEEVRHLLRGGVIENAPGRGPQARGRLGELEITVDLHTDRKRRRQSPMWRVLAVGPVRLERPIEVRIAGWEGWIDPWMQLTRPCIVRGTGLEFEAHAEDDVPLDHPALLALGRQGSQVTPGALYVRPDLMRAEVSFGRRVDQNRGLFAYLHAMGEISEATFGRAPERHGRLPRVELSVAEARRAIGR